MKRSSAGQVIIIVLVVLVLISLFVPLLVKMSQQEASWTVQERRSSIAFHMAEAGIDRGIWKLKESTATFNMAMVGTVITNYNFDKTFNDVDGGVYRIKFSSGTGTRQVIIYAEGRDNNNKETRAIKCVVQNQTIPGAIISGGTIKWQNDFEVHWGPIMSQSNIDINATAAKDYYPRKFSRQVVTGSASNPRDTNGLTPPNTDNVEWWSDYDVPELPVLNFPAMRSSAQISNTLNVYGCSKGSTASTWTTLKCNSNMPTPPNHSMHLCNTDRHPLSKKGYTWYWDGDVALTGAAAADGCGIVGNLIVRGNLYIDCGDNYYFTGPIPTDAWKEYSKFDTASTNQYPGDAGYHKNNATFQFGNQTWTGGVLATNTDVGVKGFIYVGGDLILNGIMDVNGAFWVKGNVTRLSGSGSEPILVFFDEALDVPALNVVLVRKSWEETRPSAATWY